MLFSFDGQYSNSTAVITENGDSITYTELNQLVEKYIVEHGLNITGVMLLECRNNLDSLVPYIAALRAGCPVMLIGDRNENALINLQSCFPIRYIQRAGVELVTADVVSSIHPDLAVILSTSGSTGATKAIRLSRKNITSNANSIAQYLNLTTQDCAPTTLPMQYSYGLSVINSHLISGATIWLTNHSVIESAFWKGFSEHGCTSFAGVPHTYELISKAGIDTAKLSSLRYSTQAGGRLRPELAEAFIERSIAQGWDFFIMYGQTEATARIAYLPPEVSRENSNCIGLAIPGGTLEIQDDKGQTIVNTGISGELVYRGPNVMMGYAMCGEDLARGEDLTLLRTGDLACINTNGLFYIVGRKKRFIKCLGLRIGLDEVEHWLSEKGVAAAAVGVDEKLTIFVTDDSLVNELRSVTSSWLKIPANAVELHAMDEFPRLENGKVDLGRLTSLAAEHRAADPIEDEFSIKSTETLMKELRSILGIPVLDGSKSFIELGGDSLSFIQASMVIEDHIGWLPEDWEKLPINTLLAKKRKANQFFNSVDTTIIGRAISITLVLLNHFEISSLFGSTTALFFISGWSFGKFQLNLILKENIVSPILKTVFYIVIPATLLNLFVMLKNKHAIDWPSLLMINNYSSAYYVDGGYWFINVLTHTFIVLAIIFSFSFIRERARHNIFRFAVEATVIGMVLAAVNYAVQGGEPIASPVQKIWLIFLGVAIAHADSWQKKLLVAGLTIGCAFDAILETPFAWLPLFIGWFVIAIPRVSIPSFLAKGFNFIAGASLFIYLTHLQFKGLVDRTSLAGNQYMYVLAALTGGCIVWKIWDSLFNPATVLLRAVFAKNRQSKADQNVLKDIGF